MWYGRLLEREHELAALAGAIDRARRGRGGLVLVEGPAGIGKTALLQEAGSRADELPVRVAQATASELERSFAFGVVKQLLDVVAARLGEAGAPLFEGAAEPARAVLTQQTVGRAEESFGVLHALYWVVLAVAAIEPLVMCVDDVQWADRPSLRFLIHLARRLDAAPVGVLVTLRTGESSESGDLLDELSRMPGVRLLRPPPLSERAVAVALERDPDDGFCRAAYRATAGNPFYLRELVRAVGLEGGLTTAEEIARVAEVWPRSIARYVLRRVRRVGPGASEVARAIAVLGDGTVLRHAARLAEIPDAGTVARALLDMEILAADEPLRFVHPIVSRAVYAEMPPDQRERLHLRAARLLLDDGADSDRVAAHLLAVAPKAERWVLDALRAAAHEALARGAGEVAVAYLRHAAASRPLGHDAVALLWELGIAEEHTGDPAAIEHLDEARAQCEEPKQRGEIALELARTLETRGREAEASGVLRAALEDSGAAGGDLRIRLEAALLAAAAGSAHSARPEDAALFMRLIVDVPDGPAGQIVLALAAASAVMSGGPANAAASIAEAAIERGLLESDHWDAIGACIWALILCERYDAASMYVARLHATVQRRAHTRGVALALQLQANCAERVGALADAEASARLALGMVEELELGIGSVTWIVCSLVEALVQRGELQEADETFRRITEWPLPSHHGSSATLAARGRLRFAQGQDEEAAADLLDVGRRCEEWPGMSFKGAASTHWRSSAALALHRRGDALTARRLAAEELQIAQVAGTARAVGIAARVLGIVGPADESLALLQESVETLRESPALLERAHSHAALGAALRRRGQRVRAREHLRLALDLARQCGATPLTNFSREELLAAGARPRRAALTGIESLTTSERRVADLAADGLTNRQLAQTLYVSPKTVEMHLGRVYRKLGIVSRSELARALAGA